MYHILYVDDEEDLLTVTKRFLEKTGEFQVDISTSAEDLLASGTLDNYDAIISDFQMPGMDGIAFLREIRRDYPDMPFILYTGRGREEVVIEAIDNGVDFYLQKGGEPSSQFAELSHKAKLAIQRRLSDLAHRESEEKYRSLVESMQDGVFIAQDGAIKFVNEPYARLLGYTREEIAGQPISRFVSYEDLALIMDRHTRRLAGEEIPSLYDFHLIHRDNKTRILVSLNVSTFIYNGSLAVIGTVRDVSEQRKAEQALRESEGRYRAIFENTGTAMVIIDADTTILLANTRFVHLSGYSREDIEGKKSWTDFVAAEDLQWMRDQHKMRRERHDAALTTYEFRFISRYGEMHYIMLTIDIIPGTPQSVASLLDITERRLMEDSVQQLNSRLALMNSITRHDIRNKMSALSGYIALAEDSGINDEAAELLNAMNGVIVSINSQIEFSKLYQNLGIRKPEWIRVLGILPTTQVTPSLVLTADIPDLYVYSDPMLEKVFENLLDNSIRHGGNVHTITISVEKRADELLIIWEDDGVGVPADEKQIIFERGFGKNTGLGLYLISNILAITGLTITENGEPGKGARFEIHCYLGSYRIQASSE